MGLEELRDFDPYYTNTFYSFDVDFESLKMNNIIHYICFSEAVAYDTANRMIYAGIDTDDISILPNDSDKDILSELDKFDCDNVYLITWLKKYHELAALGTPKAKEFEPLTEKWIREKFGDALAMALSRFVEPSRRPR